MSKDKTTPPEGSDYYALTSDDIGLILFGLNLVKTAYVKALREFADESTRNVAKAKLTEIDTLREDLKHQQDLLHDKLEAQLKELERIIDEGGPGV